MFNVKAKELKAFLAIVPKSEVRYMLCGIYVDAEAKTLVATDGHIMGVWRPELDGEIGESHVIPRDTVEMALKLASPKGVSVLIRARDHMLQVRAKSGEWHDLPYKPVDGRFPDYRKVIPSTLKGEAAQINATYLETCQTFLQSLTDTDKPATVHHNTKNEAGIVSHFQSPNAFCVAMPFRDDGIVPELYIELGGNAPKEAFIKAA